LRGLFRWDGNELDGGVFERNEHVKV
jgi:hypothetical protein